MQTEEQDWSEGTSRLFIDDGRYFVPEHEAQATRQLGIALSRVSWPFCT